MRSFYPLVRIKLKEILKTSGKGVIPVTMDKVIDQIKKENLDKAGVHLLC